jgi:hypothetical protein
MKRLPRLHFWTGFVGILVFLASGQYMFHAHGHLAGMADGPRMLYRSAHIYLLLCSILNLLIGVYLQPLNQRIPALLQYLTSGIILLSPFFMLTGFFLDPLGSELHRPVTRLGLYALFAIAVLLIVLGLRHKK